MFSASFFRLLASPLTIPFLLTHRKRRLDKSLRPSWTIVVMTKRTERFSLASFSVRLRLSRRPGRLGATAKFFEGSNIAKRRKISL